MAGRHATPLALRTTWTLDDVYQVLEALVVQAENQRQDLEDRREGRRPGRFGRRL